MFPGSLDKSGPKHSTSVPFSVEVAVPLSVDVKKVAFVVPNPVPDVAVKALSGPQADVATAVLCVRGHSLLLFTLQRVTPLTLPVTVQVKIKVSPGQVGVASVNCAATSPGGKHHRFGSSNYRVSLLLQLIGLLAWLIFMFCLPLTYEIACHES